MLNKITTYSYNLLPIASMLVSIYSIRIEINSTSPKTLAVTMLVGTIVLVIFSLLHVVNSYFAPRFASSMVNSKRLIKALNSSVTGLSKLSAIKQKKANIIYLDIMAPYTAWQLRKLHIRSAISWRTGKPTLINTLFTKPDWLLKVAKTLPMTNGHTAIPIRIGSTQYFGASEAHVSNSIRYIPNVFSSYERWLEKVNHDIEKGAGYDVLNYKRDKSNKVESILCIPLKRSKCVLNVVINENDVWDTFKNQGDVSTIISDDESKAILEQIGSYIDFIDYACLSFINFESSIGGR